MPFSYRIDASRRMIFSEAWGVMTEEDIRSYRERMIKDPDFRADYWYLGDYRRITKLDVSMEFTCELSHNLMSGGGARLAFVFPDDLAYGMSRMFSVMVGEADVNLRPFRDMAEARSWLGLD